MALPRARTTRDVAARPGPATTAAGLLAGAAALGIAAWLNDREARVAERARPATGRFVDVDDVAIHYHEAGDGPPVLLLHGNGASAEDMRLSGLFDRLARRHRVVAPDRPGFGYTERPRDRIWTPQAQARLFAAFADRLGLTEPVVLGHSWGTQVAIAMAQARPQGLAGLALLSGYYYPTARLDVVLMSPPAIPIVGDVLRYTVSPPVSRLIAPALFRRIFEPRKVPKRFRRGFPLDLALRPSQLRAAAADTALMMPGAASLRPGYAALDLPIRILVGDGDRIASPERQSMRLAAETGARLTVLRDAGHMIHYGDHDEIEDAVRSLSGA